MKLKHILGALFKAIGDIIAVFTSWISIISDWTNEVKEVSNNALEELRKEREVELQIAKAELDKKLEERLKQAGMSDHKT